MKWYLFVVAVLIGFVGAGMLLQQSAEQIIERSFFALFGAGLWVSMSWVDRKIR